MTKLVKGSSPGKLNSADVSLSFSWWNIVVGLLVALLAWVSSDLLPYLHDREVLSAGVLGVLTSLVPLLMNLLKNNTNVTVEKKS